jgi:hypothetical protein
MKGFKSERTKVWFFLRLNTEVNNGLTLLMRYRGDLSKFIDEALMSCDLRNIDLIPGSRESTCRGLTAVISAAANARVRAAAKRRGCTVTALANSALHRWLSANNI